MSNFNILNKGKFKEFKELKGLPLKLRIKLSLMYEPFSIDEPIFENIWDYYKRKGLSDKEVNLYYDYITKDIQNIIF